MSLAKSRDQEEVLTRKKSAAPFTCRRGGKVSLAKSRDQEEMLTRKSRQLFLTVGEGEKCLLPSHVIRRRC